MPGLTPAAGNVLGESAAVCLEHNHHRSGATLEIGPGTSRSYRLDWPTVDDRQRRCYNDLQEATERGAYGIAILVCKEITGLVVVERSRKGTGFDYWLGKQDDDNMFSNKARLEVSGILAGTPADIRARLKQKKRQIGPTDNLAPGYVAIVEFGQPAAHLEKK